MSIEHDLTVRLGLSDAVLGWINSVAPKVIREACEVCGAKPAGAYLIYIPEGRVIPAPKGKIQVILLPVCDRCCDTMSRDEIVQAVVEISKLKSMKAGREQ